MSDERRIANIFELPPLPPGKELCSLLCEWGSARVERIAGAGVVTDWYDQDEAEFAALLQGEAEIEYANGEKTALTKGDILFIRPHEKHRVSRASREEPCVWLCVFFGKAR
ncbi:MAG: cupin domain-containing protein [Oscillospiraceae bacterium]|nr:cupin domain-containing protein [Oscillospiraceae bacterium]